MTKITVSTLTSLEGESAISTLNTNFTNIVNGIENTLSRNGLAPNSMAANIDMNSFRILNMAAPVDDNDPVRLIDVVDGIQGEQGEQGAAGGPLSDGDYGDVVVTAGGTIISIDSGVLTSAGRALIDDASASAQRTTLGLGGAAVLAVGTTTGTVAAGDDSRFSRYTVTIKDATGNLALNENFLRHTSGSAHTFTIQPVATVAHPVGYQILIRNAVAGGAITLARGAGVALYINGSTSSANGTIAAGGVCTLIQDATDTWMAVGPGVT